MKDVTDVATAKVPRVRGMLAALGLGYFITGLITAAVIDLIGEDSSLVVKWLANITLLSAISALPPLALACLPTEEWPRPIIRALKVSPDIYYLLASVAGSLVVILDQGIFAGIGTAATLLVILIPWRMAGSRIAQWAELPRVGGQVVAPPPVMTQKVGFLDESGNIKRTTLVGASKSDKPSHGRPRTHGESAPPAYPEDPYFDPYGDLPYDD